METKGKTFVKKVCSVWRALLSDTRMSNTKHQYRRHDVAMVEPHEVALDQRVIVDAGDGRPGEVDLDRVF